MKVGSKIKALLPLLALVLLASSLSCTLYASEASNSKLSTQLITDGSLSYNPIEITKYDFDGIQLTLQGADSYETGIWKNYILPPFTSSTRFLKQRITSVNFPFLTNFLKIGNRQKKIDELTVDVPQTPKTESLSVQNEKAAEKPVARKSTIKRRACALLYLLAGSRGKSD
ncbi:hypothetical protein MLD52_13395 [Puniceicoccaceae bacterium K14]|nr:hypothetical protein [Puniceicoccaceae bacterium K14]